MGVIKLNPDNLKKKIKGLRDKSDEAGRARAQIDRESENLGDPSPSKAVDTFCNNSATHINNVRACANQIETEMNRIIELNENGIATKSGGVITVDNVPDTVLQGGERVQHLEPRRPRRQGPPNSSWRRQTQEWP